MSAPAVTYRPCTYCGVTGSELGEHVTPRSWRTLPLVTVPACRRCNVDKHSNDPVTWFFLLIRRDGAVLGREQTLADRRATLIAERWGNEIREQATAVLAMLPELLEAAS